MYGIQSQFCQFCDQDLLPRGAKTPRAAGTSALLVAHEVPVGAAGLGTSAN